MCLRKGGVRPASKRARAPGQTSDLQAGEKDRDDEGEGDDERLLKGYMVCTIPGVRDACLLIR